LYPVLSPLEVYTYLFRVWEFRVEIGTRSYQGLLFGPLEFRVEMGTRS
jgi:hypothetical protein